MPSTTPDGFEFEGPPEVSEDLGRTLHGGQFGGSAILAEQVQAKVSTIDNDVAGLDGRLTTVENFGTPSWVKIDSGTESDVATFVISSIPTGEFSRVRLQLFGENSTTVDPIRIRVNGDNTTDLHKSGYLTYDADGTLQFSTDLFDAEFWEIATWGTGNGCSAEVTMFGTDVFNPIGFLASGSRPASTLTGHQFTRSWGRLNSPRLLDSLRVSGPQGANFSCDWWLEGSPV